MNGKNHFEWLFRRKNGEIFPAELSLAVLMLNGRQAMLGTIRDITERKRAEQAQRDSEEQVRLLLDSTIEAIYGINLEGDCTFCNAACVRMLGYSVRRSFSGKNMHAMIHHSHPDGTRDPIQSCRIYLAFRADKGTHVENEVLWRKDGSCFPAEYWSYPIKRDDKCVGSVVTFLDITERKRAEPI